MYQETLELKADEGTMRAVVVGPLDMFLRPGAVPLPATIVSS